MSQENSNIIRLKTQDDEDEIIDLFMLKLSFYLFQLCLCILEQFFLIFLTLFVKMYKIDIKDQVFRIEITIILFECPQISMQEVNNFQSLKFSRQQYLHDIQQPNRVSIKIGSYFNQSIFGLFIEIRQNVIDEYEHSDSFRFFQLKQ